jgi:hypothetical protein
MAKSSLYSAHRAAGASSGRYKASLYDIANVGYAGEAEVGIEQFKQQQAQQGWQTLGEALSLAESVVGGIQSKKEHEELANKYGVKTSETKTSKDFTGNKAGFDMGDLFGNKSIFNKGKSTTTASPKSPSDSDKGPTSKMKKMMDIYKQKKNKEGQAPGWDPSKEGWFQEQFGESLGWIGGKTGWKK